MPDEEKRKPGRPRKVRQEPPALPISVRATLRNGKVMEFGCVGKRMENGFWVFLVPNGYRIISRYIAISEIGVLEVEEAAPAFQPMQQQTVPMGLGVTNWGTTASPQAPPVSESYSAIKGARLRAQATPIGPAAEVETENGVTVVGAGFLS